MNAKLNILFYVILFSGLGFFSDVLLVNYTEVGGALSSFNSLLFFVVVFNILGFSTMHLSSWMHEQYPRYSTRRWVMGFMYFAVILFLLLINYGLLVCAKLLVGADNPFIFPNGGVRILIIVSLVELVVFVLLLANKFMQNTLVLQREAAKLQKENDMARYAALQSQLNPHFLFNSLNTLIAEIEYDPVNAVKFTRNLSDVYRYVLQSQNRKLVSFREELDFVKAFIFLHRVRLGDFINIEVDIPDDYMESEIPPLTLQLLAENVIKHNVISAAREMNIRIRVSDEFLIFSNTLNPKKSMDGTGTGLRNLSNRCRMMTDRDIEIIETEESFTVKIPLMYE